MRQFLVINVVGGELSCVDLSLLLGRYVYIDSLRIEPLGNSGRSAVPSKTMDG
jgi:hypothetical protein